jgi:hypothetical protein
MAQYCFPYKGSLKRMIMKQVLVRPGVTSRKNMKKLQRNISLLMILFFLIMGAASLFILINSPA